MYKKEYVGEFNAIDDFKFNLEDHGILYLSEDIDEEISEYVCREIIRINCQNKQKYIQIIINSPGGFCTSGFAILDIMKWSKIPIRTFGIGMVASMAFAIFIAGEKGHRIITPNTILMSHQYSGEFYGKHSEQVANRKYQDFLHERLVQHCLKHTKLKTIKEVEKRIMRDVDTYLLPKEAIKYGAADKIVR